MKKIIISDFDDTIYVDKKIDNDSIKLIKQFRENNNLFIIASGSSYPSLINKIHDSGLEYDYLICDHGCNIIKNNKLIYNEIIDKTIIDELVNVYTLKQQGNYFVTSKDIGLVDLNNNEISKMQIEFSNRGEDFEARDYLKEKYGNKINCYCIMHNNRIEIINGNCSKLNAINKIMELEKITDYKIYTIGDGYSDIEMTLKYNGSCVENSVEELKKVSKKVYNSYNEFLNEIIDE